MTLQIAIQVNRIVRTNEQGTSLYRLYRRCYLSSTKQRLSEKRIFTSLTMYVRVIHGVVPLEDTHVQILIT